MSGPPLCALVLSFVMNQNFLCLLFVSRNNKTNNSYHSLFLFWKKNNIIFLFLDIFEKLSFSSSLLSDETREYWMIYKGLCLLAIVWFGSPPHPLTPLPVVSLTGDTQEDCERETTCWRTREGGGGEEGAKSYDAEKAWSSINRSTHSGVYYPTNPGIWDKLQKPRAKSGKKILQKRRNHARTCPTTFQ